MPEHPANSEDRPHTVFFFGLKVALPSTVVGNQIIYVVVATADLHIYNLDTIPPIHIVRNHVATDKLTTANGGTFTSNSARLSSQSRQSTSVTDRACCNVIGY